MKITVRRDIFTNLSTTSKVYIDGAFFGYALEDMDRHLEDGGVKVPGETAIPRGTYQVILNYSERFKQVMPLLVDVPGYQGVRIHVGNTPADTHGCILVGTVRREDFIGNSRAAYMKLFDLIAAELDAKKSVEIEIS